MDSTQEILTGGLVDTRPDDQKAQDHQHDEVVMAGDVVANWREKSAEEIKSFPERFQSTSLSCMAQSGVKTLGVHIASINGGHFPILTAKPVYDSRSNYPDGGMAQPDLFMLLTKPLACKESDVPSQNLGETAMNQKVTLTDSQMQEAQANEADGYLYLNPVMDWSKGTIITPVDIDKIASMLEQGKAVHLMMFFTGNEWWAPYPKESNPALNLYNGSLHHGISAVDYTLYNGEKALVIEDSAGNWTGINGHGVRIVTESFLKARCFGAGYPVKKSFVPPSNKPRYTFSVPLTYGMLNNPDVKALQEILQFEGFMPTLIDNKPFSPTGNFFGMTALALKKWQVAHGIMDFQNTTDPRLIRFGFKSIALANQLYSV